MRLLRQTLILMLIGLCLVFFPVLLGVTSDLKDSCPAPNSKDPTAYQQRDDNRCEGIKSRRVATTHAELVSVTLKPDSKVGKASHNPLFLQVRARTDIYNNGNLRLPSKKIDSVVVRDFRRNYRLDPFSLQKADPYLTFQWPTEILTEVGSKLAQLHGTAQDDFYSFAPVIISPPSLSGRLHYEFGIFDEEKFLTLKSFEIYDPNGQRVDDGKLVADSSLPQQEFLTVKWDGNKGGKALSPGLYSVKFQVEIRDQERVNTPPSQTYQFVHDPALLK